MKTPKIIHQLSAALTPQPKKKLQATARAARPEAMDDYDDDEQPTTRLSSAFIVVLILHVVAIGGIYAFNSIKASRKAAEPAPALAVKSAENPSLEANPAETSSAPAVRETTRPATSILPPVSTPNVVETGFTPVTPSHSNTGNIRQYVIKAGDSLTRIAFAYGVAPAELMSANGLKESAVLHAGQTLIIPGAHSGTRVSAAAAAEASRPEIVLPKTSESAPAKNASGTYAVKKGDTATSIARAAGMSVEDLLKLNKISDPKKLQINQVLKIARKN